jgi:hypothetical protein
LGDIPHHENSNCVEQTMANGMSDDIFLLGLQSYADVGHGTKRDEQYWQ